jgi:tRNA(adenine34) deaminase
MRLALEEARRAERSGEVPIGAVAVFEGSVVGSGFNRPIAAMDPTAHAEIIALREAAAALKNYRLTNVDLYVTLEPCLMCVGALVHARVRTVIYGAREPKTGALVSATRALEIPALNHRFEVVGEILEDECRRIVQEFFEQKRGSR